MSFSPGGPGLFTPQSNIRIPGDCDVVFVADLFATDYQGGAELTSEALIASSPLRVFKLHSKDVTLDLLREGHQKFWIFGNYANLDFQLIPSIVANLKYSILEYDYKYCRYRSTENHEAAEGAQCNCHNEQHGKMVSAFMYGARSLWWMSEGQRDWYLNLFPFLAEKNNTVLSSVFDDATFAAIKMLRDKYKDVDRKGWVVLDSPSWVKGANAAKQWAAQNGKDTITLWGKSYGYVLETLAQAEGFVYLPRGKDTCPRMVIEAKLLGCQLELNDYVQHKDEIWFTSPDRLDTESYLYMARSRFWDGIKADMEYQPTISGYTTVRNCISQNYPFIDSIRSMMGFCDEVVVVDGGSDDGTWEALNDFVAANDCAAQVKVHQVSRDWNHKRFAVFDGDQKAKARALCTKEFCWQQDSDEIVHEDDYTKIRGLVSDFPNGIQLLSLPVIEYWGGPDKVRMDILPWKWRLSRNLPHITHGIPVQFRKFDEEGNLYASPGTDGCDYIHAETFQVIPHTTFYTQEAHNARLMGMSDSNARDNYEHWFNQVVSQLPGVHHYSWFDIARKIRTYRDYWSQHWQSLYDIKQEDTAENNMFFDRPWSEVSEADIEDLAIKLSKEMGGWIFHERVDFSKPTPHITVHTGHPSIVHRRLSHMIDNENSLSEASRLVDFKDHGNWNKVRNENLYERIVINFPWGSRTALKLKSNHQDYVDLQQSRGIPVEFDDDPGSIVGRAISAVNVIQESDQIRINELDKLIPSVHSFAELGFRVPKLIKFYQDRGASPCRGYDVATLSLEVGKKLGYDVRHYDFNIPRKQLDLTGIDVVVSYHMLEHVTNPSLAVQKIYDSMGHGTYFHVEVPIEPDGPHLQFAHLFPFHPGDLREILVAAGFQLLNFSTTTHSNGPMIERYLARKVSLS